MKESVAPPLRVVESVPQGDGKQRALFEKLPERVQGIIARGLANRAVSLSEEDSLAVLTACIELGLWNAELAEGSIAVMVVGNTGAGKSTLINFLLKCVMEKVYLSLGGKRKVVFMVSEASPVKAVMQIGFSNTSQTFVPDAVQSPDLGLVVDCPGFNDNRSPEINIANAVNIKAVMTRALGVTMVVVLNYYTLKADRGRGVRELLETLLGLFGSAERALIHADSILLVVSHVPVFSEAEDRVMELQDVKNEFDSNGLSPNMAALLEALLERVCIFHPEDKGGASWLTADQLVARIKATPPIEAPKEVFQIVLNSADEAKLRALVEALFDRLKAALDAVDADAAAKLLSDLQRLDVVDHVTVARFLESATARVRQALVNRAFEAQSCVLLDNFAGAAALLGELRALADALASAAPAAAEALNLAELTARADVVEAAAASRQADKARREEQDRATREMVSNIESLRRALDVAVAQQQEFLKTEATLKGELAQAKAQAAKEAARLNDDKQRDMAILQEKLASASAEEKKKLEARQAVLEAKFAAELREREEAAAQQAALLTRLLEDQERSRRANQETERAAREAIAQAEAEKKAAEVEAAEDARRAEEARKQAQDAQRAAEDDKKAEVARRAAAAKQADEEQKAREAEAARNAEEKRRAEKAQREAEEKAKREAEERAKREAEEKAKREAVEKAKREAEERAKREAEERAKREAEEKAKREAVVEAAKHAVAAAAAEASNCA